MSDIRWHFNEMSPADLNHNPMEREFFEGEPINIRLARESIQNSLDAGADKAAAPIRVRFSLFGIHRPLPEGRAIHYFEGLAEHLHYVDDLDDRIAERVRRGNLAAGGVPYIVIEDAGTTGLTGDWQQYDDSPAESARDNNFYWFFRNIGRSGKGGSDNGSWGLGKWVFPDASRISSYLAVTRRDDDETLLIGQSILVKHTIGEQRYTPYGYLATLGEDELPLPLRRSEPQHRVFIEQCIADFGLQLRDESGLSIIIPFPRTGDGDEEGISKAGLVTAIVSNYFYPIIAGRLEATVDEGDGTPPVRLTADTIDEAVGGPNFGDDGRERNAEAYRKIFALTRECIALPKSRYHNLAALPVNDADDGRRKRVAELRPNYDAGELLAFQVETDVQRKKGSTEDTKFRLYIQKDDALSEGQDYYVRGTLSVSQMDNIHRHRARALLVVDEGEGLAEMLRDSEPPAHTRWRPQARRVIDRWVAPQRRITAVRNAPATLLSILEAETAGLQKDVFADIFFWEDNGSDQADQGRIGEGRSSYRTDRRIPPPRPRDFNIAQSGDGLRVTVANEAQSVPAQARLQVAYEIPRGNPLRHYHTEDFALHGDTRNISVDVKGCRAEAGNKGNVLLLADIDPNSFAITLRGFDQERDVYIRIDKIG